MGILWVEWKGLKYCLDLSIIRLLLSFGLWVGFEALLPFDVDHVSKILEMVVHIKERNKLWQSWKKICSVMDEKSIL